MKKILAAGLTLFLLPGVYAQVGSPSVSITTGGSGSGSSNGTSVSSGICSTAAAVTTTGLVIETVATCALPAGFLAVDGQSVTFTASGSCAANANSKTVQVVFGADTVGTAFTSTGCNNTTWMVQGQVIRRSATTQAMYWGYQGNGNAGNGSYTAGAQTLANSISVLLRLTTPVAAGDLTMQSFQVKTP